MTFEPTFTYAAAVGCANFASLWLMFAYLAWHGRRQSQGVQTAGNAATQAAALAERTDGRLTAVADDLKATARDVAADLALASPPRP